MQTILRSTLAIMLFALVAGPTTSFAQSNNASSTTNSKSGVSAKKKTRERNITREAKVSKDKKHVDFDAVDIEGDRRTPMGTMVNQTNSDKNHDLIRLRTDWHPEMIQSASTIETSR